MVIRYILNHGYTRDHGISNHGYTQNRLLIYYNELENLIGAKCRGFLTLITLKFEKDCCGAAVADFIFHLYGKFILLTCRKESKVLYIRPAITPNCFRKCQDIAIRLKILILFFSFIKI